MSTRPVLGDLPDGFASVVSVSGTALVAFSMRENDVVASASADLLQPVPDRRKRR